MRSGTRDAVHFLPAMRLRCSCGAAVTPTALRPSRYQWQLSLECVLLIWTRHADVQRSHTRVSKSTLEFQGSA